MAELQESQSTVREWTIPNSLDFFSEKCILPAIRIMDKHHKPRRALGLFLVLLFVLAMIMGVGSGVRLVNRPDTLLGLPGIYTWGLFWYAVHIVIVIMAYRFLWRRPSDPDRCDRERP